MLYFLTVFCLPLSTIDNGNITYTTPLAEEGYVFDTLAELNCNSGYKPSASSPKARRCERLGNWSGEIQTCVAGILNRII